jgi:hypothetical protein
VWLKGTFLPIFWVRHLAYNASATRTTFLIASAVYEVKICGFQPSSVKCAANLMHNVFGITVFEDLAFGDKANGKRR